MDSDMPAGMDGLLEAVDIAWAAVAAAATTVPMTGLANDSPLNETLPVTSNEEVIDASTLLNPVPVTSPLPYKGLTNVPSTLNEMPHTSNEEAIDASTLHPAPSITSKQDTIDVETPKKPKPQYFFFPLWHLGKWYEDLQFASIIDDPFKAIASKWNFHIVIISPSAPEREFIKNQKTKTQRVKFESLLIAFYRQGFTKNCP